MMEVGFMVICIKVRLVNFIPNNLPMNKLSIENQDQGSVENK